MSNFYRKQSSDLGTLHDAVHRLVEDSLYLPQAVLDQWTGEESIPVDMYEENNAIVIKAALPGMKPEDLKVEVHENVLTISGQIKQESNHKEGDYLLNERYYGQVQRSESLPREVKVDQAEAEFEDGVLILIMPKAGAITVKKIAVTSKANKAETK